MFDVFEPDCDPSSPAEVQLCELSDDSLEAEILTLAGHIAAATCRFLELVAEAECREMHYQWGCRSAAEWLSVRLGIGLSTAFEHLRVARALKQAPLIHAVFARGEISYSKVRALTRIVTPANEEILVEYAQYATGSQLDRIVGAFRGAKEAADPNLEQARLARRYLHYRVEADGSLTGSFRLPPETGSVVVAAIEAAANDIDLDSPAGEEESGEPASWRNARDPAGARSVDALVRIATASMACKDTDERTLPLPSVILHVEAGSESNPSGISIQGGPQVSKSLAARLACDSTVTTQVEQGGLPIDLGRRKRVVSTSLRRALLARDGGCRFPGCYRYRFIHAHHIVHWADGGSTDLDNLINLCSYHHQMLHEAGWSMARDDAGEINFFGPSGQPIHRKCARISGDLASLRQYNESIGVAINADTCIPKGAGERYSLSMAVDGLFSCEGQAASEAA